VVHPTIFEGRTSGTKPPLHLDFMPDLDGDGFSDLLFFARDRLLVFFQDSGEFRLKQKIAVDIESTMMAFFGPQRRALESTKVPTLVVGDIDGDKRADLVFFKDDALTVHFQRDSGAFDAGKRIALTQKRPKRRRHYIQFEVPPRIVDIDGDGLLDIALTQPTKGRVHLYVSTPGRADYTVPDQEVRIADSLSGGTEFRDFDGDGRRDLIMWSVPKPGITGVIEAFISRKIAIELYLFRTGADGRVEQPAKQQLSFSIPFTAKLTREAGSVELEFEPNFDGDFNRDGCLDMLAMNEGRLQVWFGSKTTLLEARPRAVVPTAKPASASFTRAIVREMNGDGKADIVLRHVDISTGAVRLEVKLSK
jgi:hypothetical protein